MPKPLATYSLKNVVRVKIKGKRLSDNIGHYDCELVNAFHQFLREAGIYPAVRGGTFGGGLHIADYSQEDAERIHKWLVQHGAKRTEYMR
jgi:hypothetical protein